MISRPLISLLLFIGAATLTLCMGLALKPVPAIDSEAAVEDNGRPTTFRIERGRQVYARYCAGCHGEEGDGQGEAAALLYPKPRDFVTAEFKFSSRRTPDLPTDADLMALLERGLKGTAMTSFRHLPLGERRAVIATIKTFSDRWDEEPRAPIAFSEDPWANDPEAGIAKGDRAYHVDVTCNSCHPSYHSSDEIDAMTRAAGYEPMALRPDAHLSVVQENADGSLVLPPDFRRDWLKSGADVQTLYRVIGAGITTTAMPTWVDTLPPDQLWGLAYYIHWLAEQRPFLIDPSQYATRPPVDLLELDAPGADDSEPESGDEPEFIEDD